MPSSYVLLGGFAIGARGLRCYGNIARTRNVSECLCSLYAWLYTVYRKEHVLPRALDVYIAQCYYKLNHCDMSQVVAATVATIVFCPYEFARC